MKPIVILLLLGVISCQQNPAAVHPEPKEEEPYFPTNSFFENQIAAIDSMKLPIVQYRSWGKHKDTAQLSTSDIRRLVADFTSIDLNAPSTRPFYKESSFADQSTSTATFTYKTDKHDLPLRRMDVIITPNPVSNDKVKSIYAERLQQKGDSSIFQKLFWQANKNFRLITSTKVAKDSAQISTTLVSWN